MLYSEIRTKQDLSYISFSSFRILYGSKFVLMTSFGANAVVVTRVLCKKIINWNRKILIPLQRWTFKQKQIATTSFWRHGNIDVESTLLWRVFWPLDYVWVLLMAITEIISSFLLFCLEGGLEYIFPVIFRLIINWIWECVLRHQLSILKRIVRNTIFTQRIWTNPPEQSV